MSTTTSTTRTRADVTTELEALTVERDAAKGSARAAMTRKVKQLTTELATMPATEKRWRKGAAFDSARIVELANSGSVNTASELAEAMGIELDGRLTRRLSCLVNVDGLVGEQFLIWEPPVKAKPEADAPVTAPAPDLTATLAKSITKAKPRAARATIAPTTTPKAKTTKASK